MITDARNLAFGLQPRLGIPMKMLVLQTGDVGIDFGHRNRIGDTVGQGTVGKGQTLSDVSNSTHRKRGPN